MRILISFIIILILPFFLKKSEGNPKETFTTVQQETISKEAQIMRDSVAVRAFQAK